MNTLTIAFLLVCVGAAYASALPAHPAPGETLGVLAAQPAHELLQGDESRHGGGYNRRGGFAIHRDPNYGYHRGGGGGNHGGNRGGGRGWGK